MKSSSERLIVPAPQWESLTDIYSAMLVSESKKPVPSVFTARYQGRLFTSFAIYYRLYTEAASSELLAWELTPRGQYQGRVHDHEQLMSAYERNEQDRGDHTGLVVRVRGHEWVCSELVILVKGLPEFPISLMEAKSEDSVVLPHQDQSDVWKSYKGHPVTLGAYGHLYFRKEDGHIATMTLGKDLPYEDAQRHQSSLIVEDVVTGANGQLGMLL